MEKNSKIVFKKISEPVENAFTMSIPEGFIIEGGIFRISPIGGSLLAASGKIDMTIKSDSSSKVMLRLLPSVYFFDPKYSFIPMPYGSTYQGMTVMPVQDPINFLINVAFPYAHQRQYLNDTHVIKHNLRPDILEDFIRKNPPIQGFTQSAGEVHFTYNENNIKFWECIIGVVQDMGRMGNGLWGNHDTILMRSPYNESEYWGKIFQVMCNSIKLNYNWIVNEMNMQKISQDIIKKYQDAEKYRAERLLKLQREIQSIENDIVYNRQKTNEEIMNDQYLMLTNQEEYVNPFTDDIDTASNQWKYRWVSNDGREFYSDLEDDNPNYDKDLGVIQWKMSKPRKRFG